jgi:hypothetical protein
VSYFFFASLWNIGHQSALSLWLIPCHTYFPPLGLWDQATTCYKQEHPLVWLIWHNYSNTDGTYYILQ